MLHIDNTYNPKRKIPCRRGVNRGIFPSRKMNRGVWYESLLERDFLCLAEYHSSIISYYEQPYEISSIHHGKRYIYYPDFLCIFKDKIPTLYEISHSSKLMSPDMKTKIQVGYEFSQKMGIMYKVVTEKDLSQGSYVENIKVILGFSDLPQTFNCYLSEILEIVRKRGEMRISSIGMFFPKIEKSPKSSLHRKILKIRNFIKNYQIF